MGEQVTEASKVRFAIALYGQATRTTVFVVELSVGSKLKDPFVGKNGPDLQP